MISSETLYNDHQFPVSGSWIKMTFTWNTLTLQNQKNKQSDPDPVPISLERIFLYPLLIFFHGKAEIAQGSRQGRQQPGAESCLHHPGEEECGAHLQFHSPHWCTVSQLICTAWDQGFQIKFHQSLSTHCLYALELDRWFLKYSSVLWN